MGGQAKKVNAHVLHVKRYLPRRLHRVGVKQHAATLTQSANLADRLKRADLIISSHHAD